MVCQNRSYFTYPQWNAGIVMFKIVFYLMFTKLISFTNRVFGSA